MTDYCFAEINGSKIESIKTLLNFICKEKNIHQERQNYKILFDKEKLSPKNNNIIFTSGSKKHLSFYGKLYLNIDKEIVETIYLNTQDATIKPYSGSLLIIYGGIGNSTVVQTEEDAVYFYIAPEHLLDLQDPKKWEYI